MGLNRSSGIDPGQKIGKRGRRDAFGGEEVREVIDSECPECSIACQEYQKTLQCYLCERWYQNKYVCLSKYLYIYVCM